MICFVTSDMRETCKFSKFLLHCRNYKQKPERENQKQKGPCFVLVEGKKKKTGPELESKRERESRILRRGERHHQEQIIFFSAERETKIEKKKIAELEIS